MRLIPYPTSLEAQPGHFRFTPETGIGLGEGTERLGAVIRKSLPFDLKPGELGRPNTLSFRLDPGLMRSMGREGYHLLVEASGVQAIAAEPAGLFYALQTLRQLLPAESLREGLGGNGEFLIPCVRIEDRPAFAWRGALVDVSRHFMPKSALLKFIDLLAFHKLNRLHLHLTDDQGWRVEILRYPKLTEVGAWRRRTMVGHYNDQKWNEIPHGGFYSQADLREIVSYASARNVTVMPEIEMPGHASAAIASYPELGNTGNPIPVGDTWGVIHDVFNVKDETIAFLQGVLEEVLDIFPSEFIHIGGDECPKDQWKASAHAQQRIRELGLQDEHELQSWFIRQIDAWLDARGRRLVGWDEILEGGLAPGATVMSWRGEEGGIAAAQAGHDVVMTPGSHTYFDHYQAEPKELEPVAIGGLTTLEKAYSYSVVPAALSPEQARHVLGSQFQLWSEYIPNPRHLEYMAFPRGAAFAEVVWTGPGAHAFGDFQSRLGEHLQRLAALDVDYRGRWLHPYRS